MWTTSKQLSQYLNIWSVVILLVNILLPVPLTSAKNHPAYHPDPRLVNWFQPNIKNAPAIVNELTDVENAAATGNPVAQANQTFSLPLDFNSNQVASLLKSDPASVEPPARIDNEVAQMDINSSFVDRMQTTQTITPSGLLFIENVGQFDHKVRFMVRGSNGTLYLTDDALWLTILEPTEHQTRTQKLKEAGGHRSGPPTPKLKRNVSLKLSFLGANSKSPLEPFNRLDTRVSYFTGNDPTQWRPDVPVWAGVRYIDFFPGIDLEITGQNGRLVQRLVVRDISASPPPPPGEGWGQWIRLRVDGADTLALQDDQLLLTTAIGEFNLPLFQVVGADGDPLDVPLAQPEINGREITAPFSPASTAFLSPITSPFTAHLAALPPPSAMALQITSPDLVYSTYLGENNSDIAYAIAVDGTGNAYVTGDTSSSDFPEVPGSGSSSNQSAFVVKLNAPGSDLIYVVMLEGSDDEAGVGIAVDSTGSAYVTGHTYSSNFPVTSGAFDTTLHGIADAFVVKLNPTGTGLTYATYLGGSDRESSGDITVDQTGNAYVTGGTWSSDFPALTISYDSTFNSSTSLASDAFVVKLNMDGSERLFATFLGGSYSDGGSGIAIDATGNVYITGSTGSHNFPTTSGVFDTSCGTDGTCNAYGTDYFQRYSDVFVSKLQPDGADLVYSTYLGGNNSDSGAGIAIDGAGNAYVAGQTRSTDFPTTTNAFDTSCGTSCPWGNAFAIKLSAGGSGLTYGTFLGGDDLNGWEAAHDIAVNEAGQAYVGGETGSQDFPTTPDAFDDNGPYDYFAEGFVSKLKADGTGLVYSTYLGGRDEDYVYSLALDDAGDAYLTGEVFAGQTFPADFPITPGAFDSSPGLNEDAFVTKLALGDALLTLDILDPPGNSVDALILNADGWPTPNPLTVKVTLNCPAGGPDCGNQFRLMIDSNLPIPSEQAARFYVYSKDVNSSGGQVTCVETTDGPSSSSYSYTVYEDHCFEESVFGTLSLAPGETKIMRWYVWIQPSVEADLEFSAFFGPSFPTLGHTASQTVHIPLAQIHPIVFIHGLGATLPLTDQQGWGTSIFDPGWNNHIVTNLFTKYTDLFKTLEKMGYEEGRTLFFYNYRWLYDITKDASAKLKSKMLTPAAAIITGADGIPWVKTYDPANVNGGVKFDIVTHSTGALVARAYIQIDDLWNNHSDVRRLVTVAGPHRGVPKIYKGWEGGDPALDALNSYVIPYMRGEAYRIGYWHYECPTEPALGVGSCVWDVSPEEAYRFTHDPIEGLTIMPQFLPDRTSEEPAFFQAADNEQKYPFDRQVNPLWEPETNVNGMCNLTRDDIYRVCDPYSYDHLDYNTSYYGLNTPNKMKLLAQRLDGLDNMAIIYGNGFDMLQDFKVNQPSETAPYWRNGKPLEGEIPGPDGDLIPAGEIQGPGDETVPAISGNPQKIWVDENGASVNIDYENIPSIFDNPDDGKPSIFNVQGMHNNRYGPNSGGLTHAPLTGYTESQDAVVRMLTHITLPQNFVDEYGPAQASQDQAQFEAIASKGLLISAFSPIELTLTDSQGHHLGYDPATGDDLFEIPYGMYQRDQETGHKSLFIFSPEAGEATLTLTAVGTGDYTLIGVYSDEAAVVNLFALTGTVTSSQTEVLTFTIPTTSTEVAYPPEVEAGPDLIVDIDQPLTFAGQFRDINPADTHEIGWNFGDGVATVTGTLTPTHTFTSEGVFTVTLTVTDSYSFVVDDSLQVTVVNTTAFQEIGGQVVMEAEHFTGNASSGNRTWLTQTVLSDYAGPGYMSALPDTDLQFTTAYTPTGPELSYTINFTTTGTYYVWLRGYAPNAAGDSVYLGQDDQLVTTLTGFTPRKWGWGQTTQYGPAAIYITKPGLHTLHLWQREDGLRLDRMVLSTNSSYNPAGVGPAESEVR